MQISRAEEPKYLHHARKVKSILIRAFWFSWRSLGWEVAHTKALSASKEPIIDNDLEIAEGGKMGSDAME